MLKFTYLAQLGLVGALALPAIGPQTGSLEQALARTERTLAELLGREQRADADDGSAVMRALSISEPPLGDPRERDELLEHLRRDVGRLQQELDEVEVHGARAREPRGGPQAPADAVPQRGVPSTAGPASRGPAPSPPARTGLDDDQRALLGSLAAAAPLPPAFDGFRARTPLALEPPGYSADPARHARAYFRAGRYAEGLDVLAREEASPEAAYWRARCLERLGRLGEALAAYEQAIALAPESELGRRASADREFLTWHAAFESRLAARRQP